MKFLPKPTDQEILKKKNESLSQQLDEKSKDLANLAMKAHSKDVFLGDLKTKLKEMIISGNSDSGGLNRLISKIDEKINQNREWEVFEEQFNLINSDFFKKLKNDYPKLSVSEVKLCMLLKNKMSTKEIANLLHLSVRGVETRRYRLRKKLELSKSTDLEEFIDRI